MSCLVRRDGASREKDAAEVHGHGTCGVSACVLYGERKDEVAFLRGEGVVRPERLGGGGRGGM